MQLPRTVRERTQAGTDEQASVSDQPSGSRLGRLRAVLAAVGAAVAAYVAVRWLRSSSDSDSSSGAADSIPSADEVRETATEFVPDEASNIPIGVPGEDEDEPAEDGGEGEPAEDAGEETEPDRTTENDDADESETLQNDADTVLSEERSQEEIAERAEEDVRNEPAEPGEMAVDDDVVSDIVDEDLESDDDTDEE